MPAVNERDTKLTADIAESAAITKLLKLGFRVLKPVGDRLPYDLALDLKGRLVRLQVKSAWRSKKGFYAVDSRRTKTNRRRMLRSRYRDGDFDFAIIYIEVLDLFYVMPVKAFTDYKSGIAFVEGNTRQRPPASRVYREAWYLIR